MSVLALLIFTGLSCSTASPVLSVYAAAGAKPPLDEICRQYQEQCKIHVEISYGSGGEVLSQMVLSRRGDVYIAPEQYFMESAQDRQAIDPETIVDIAYMVPVIIVARDNPKHITDLADLAGPDVKVAVTRQETTLLGKYAPEIFKKAGLSEQIGSNIVTEAARPDSLLTMLVMGQVDAGIIWHIYGTQASEDVEILFLQPDQLTGIGQMQIAVSAYSRDKKASQDFIDFITSVEGKAVFKEFGYFVDAGEVNRYWQ